MRQSSWGAVRAGVAALAVVLAAGGCATFRGEPRSLTAPDQYDESTVLAHYATLRTEGDLVAYRNQVAYRWIAAADLEYDAFRHSLSREMKGLNVGSDLAVLVMNGAAVVSGADAARALAVGSATVLGANATLTREAFLEQSLGTALTTAQASRTRQLTQIRRQLLQRTAQQYPLGDVLIDIRALNEAASINNASAAMAERASTALVSAQEEAAAVVRLSVAPADVHSVRAAFSEYVRGQEDRAVLDRLAGVLAASADDNTRLYQQNIMDAYAQRAEGGAQAINALAPALKAITGRDFVL
ncbi:MAG: hypothetical protein ACK4Y4_04915 [Brevundimonas sp.]